MNEKSTICLDCLGVDPMHAADDGWLGDCPWFLRATNTPGHDPEGICSYGCWEEPECQTCCPGIEPDGWGPNPNGAPCETCGGIGVVHNIRDSRHPNRTVFL